jgi:5-hydroxyisourate hydrolase
LAVTLQRRESGSAWKEVAAAVTDADGRVRRLGEELPAGEYRLEFDTGSYFERSGISPFYPTVTVIFNFDGGELHVPLLLSAYGYSTYKGT